MNTTLFGKPKLTSNDTGAIMFNDSLTLGQCQRLVQQLSQTAFPFQCAHGRPSLVPLVHIDGIASLKRREALKIDWSKLGLQHDGMQQDD